MRGGRDGEVWLRRREVEQRGCVPQEVGGTERMCGLQDKPWSMPRERREHLKAGQRCIKPGMK